MNKLISKIDKRKCFKREDSTKATKTTRAFTLLEMLLVIAMIAILAGIVIVAINPGRQLAQARNVQRTSDLRALNSAIYQYYIDNLVWPGIPEITETLTEICDEDGKDSEGGQGCVNLFNHLVPVYLSTIPRDPQASSGTSYKIAINQDSQTPQLIAEKSDEYGLALVQLGVKISTESEENPYQVTTAGLVGYWNMENSNNTVPDIIGTNEGNAINGVQFNEDYGVIGKGASFDGINDYISIPQNIQLNSFTMSFWFKRHNSSKPMILIDSGWWLDSTQNVSLLVMIHSESHASLPNKLMAGVRTYSNVPNVISNEQIINNEWYHVAMSADSQHLNLYINGKLDISIPANVNALSTQNLYLGERYYSMQQMVLNGYIDELRIYNNALSSNDILEIYNHDLHELNNK